MIINTAQGGGTAVKYNVFCQPDEPAVKDGIWLKTATAVNPKKIVFDSNVWAAQQWQNPSLAADMSSARQDACCAVVGDEIFIFGGNNRGSLFSSAIAYKPSTNTYRTLADMPSTRYSACCATIGDEVFIFGGYNSSSYLSSVECLKLTAKQYLNNPSFLIYALDKDTTYKASLMTTKLCDYLPSYFKDAMLFKDSNITFPQLYVGNGTSWTKIREAQ